MKFKIDENLPIEIAELLQAAGYDAITVVAQKLGGESDPVIAEVCRQENRILVTVDLDFADIQTYPPQDFPGIIVLRVNRQEKPYLISVFQRTIPLLTQEFVEHRLWIVEETRVRIRGGEETN
jgi:predicted nuclease of predicted toxin-antitoxin system